MPVGRLGRADRPLHQGVGRSQAVLLLDVATRAFRNLGDAGIALSPRATVLTGENGQGKTNFLEACYLACTLRPLRAQKLAELVRFGSPSAQVAARFLLPGGARSVEVEIAEGRRVARLDQKPVRDPDELFGGLAVVAFTPDDLALVKGSPDGRRRLLDRAVQNRHPGHLADSRDYLRALKSRNQLLRDKAPAALLEAFDQPLARLGALLRLRRQRVLSHLRPHAERAYSEVTRGEVSLGLAYLAAGRDSNDLGEAAIGMEEGDAVAQALLEGRLRAALDARLPRDRERGFTSVGPHADDLGLVLGGRSARLFASQGQARAIVLAFKIGEIESLRASQGRAPLLLLDDVSSELDPERNGFLMRYLAALRGQVLLTTTDPRLVSAAIEPGKAGDAAGEEPLFYTVRQGSLTRVER